MHKTGAKIIIEPVKKKSFYLVVKVKMLTFAFEFGFKNYKTHELAYLLLFLRSIFQGVYNIFID